MGIPEPRWIPDPDWVWGYTFYPVRNWDEFGETRIIWIWVWGEQNLSPPRPVAMPNYVQKV
jgi:hypothetical protein